MHRGQRESDAGRDAERERGVEIDVETDAETEPERCKEHREAQRSRVNATGTRGHPQRVM